MSGRKTSAVARLQRLQGNTLSNLPEGAQLHIPPELAVSLFFEEVAQKLQPTTEAKPKPTKALDLSLLPAYRSLGIQDAMGLSYKQAIQNPRIRHCLQQLAKESPADQAGRSHP